MQIGKCSHHDLVMYEPFLNCQSMEVNYSSVSTWETITNYFCLFQQQIKKFTIAFPRLSKRLDYREGLWQSKETKDANFFAKFNFVDHCRNVPWHSVKSVHKPETQLSQILQVSVPFQRPNQLLKHLMKHARKIQRTLSQQLLHLDKVNSTIKII